MFGFLKRRKRPEPPNRIDGQQTDDFTEAERAWLEAHPAREFFSPQPRSEAQARKPIWAQFPPRPGSGVSDHRR